MMLNHNNTKIGKDQAGIFAMINFGPKWVEKVYIDELFEEYANKEMNIDISLKPHGGDQDFGIPEAFYDQLDPQDRDKIKEELYLKAFYPEIDDDLNLFLYLKKIHEKYPPALQFKAKSIDEHKDWAKNVIEKVKELVHYNMQEVPLKIEEGPTTRYKNIELKKIYIHTAEFLKIPAILAKPIEIKAPVPAIICVHGHNKGKINTIGMEKSSSNSYYGIDLALRGYVTISLDQWGWGERRMQNKRQAEIEFEKIITRSALLFGFTAIGIRCWEVSRVIDYLETLEYVNNRCGIIGQSGGGTTASFSSVIDPRIDAAVISGYYCTWMHSIFAMNHCICNFVPGIMNYFDQQDMVASRAPKPTFIVAGEKDPIFPIDGVNYAYNKLKEAYSLYNKEDNLGIDIIKDTGHVFRGDKAYPWLDKVLNFNH